MRHFQYFSNNVQYFYIASLVMFENETFLVIFKHCESKEGFEYLFLGVSPLLLSPHEALGHKFWLKGGEREKNPWGHRFTFDFFWTKYYQETMDNGEHDLEKLT